MTLIMYRLKQDGRAGVILPDGFLFGDDNSKIAIKEKLLKEFNLHTIVRIPSGAFAPYTSISTNLLFFDNTNPTKKVDYYQVPLPDYLKNGFTKTKPLKETHLDGVREWWDNRDKEEKNAYSIELDKIKEANYNLDFKNPNNGKEEKEYKIDELLQIMDEKAKSIKETIEKLTEELEGVEE